jgi:hypothetical protein
MRRAIVILSISLAACGTCEEKTAPAPAPAPPKPTAVVVDAGPQPATKVEIVKKRENLRALEKGRKATVAKDWKAAIVAFDEAVKIDPSDARAYAERGYAHLLQGDDLDAAEMDFARAAELTKDASLLTQIWWNHGLLDEKRDAKDNALVDFWIADQVKPNPAAKAKIAGKRVCPLRAAPPPNAGGKLVLDAPDWLGLANTAATERDDLEARPKSAEEARLVMLGTSAEPALPAIATAGSAGHGRAVYVVGKHGRGLRGVYVGGEWGGRCPGEISFEMVAVKGSIAHVRGRELMEGGYSFMCTYENGDHHRCSDGDMNDDKIGKQSYCAGGTPTVRDVAVDVEAGRVLATIERPELAKDATVKLVDGGLQLSGLECADRVVSFTP